MVKGKVMMSVAVVIALIAGVIAYRLWWPSDEHAIRKQLALIEKAGSKKEGEQSMEGLVRATQLAALFGEPCRFVMEPVQHDGTYPRKLIQERILLVRSTFANVEVSLHDIAIERIENKTATVRGTLRLRGKSIGDQVADAQEFQTEMAKIDGQWLFTSVTLVEVLQQ